MRIIGLSGLGKTRLALEAFRPRGLNAIEDDFLARNTVYIDMNQIAQDTLISFIEAWHTSSKSGFFIVDNCSLALHEALIQEIPVGSSIKLLTLNFEPTSIGSGLQIQLFPEKDSVIEQMLIQKYPNLSTQDLKRVIEFSCGFPGMAKLIADAYISELDLAKIPNCELAQRLIWGRNPVDRQMLTVLSVCALFNEFGWEGDSDDYKTIHTISSVPVSDRAVHQWIVDYLTRGIIIKHNDALLLSPKPLALQLAAQWLRGQPGDYLRKIIETLPPELLIQFANQFSLLDFSSEAKKITADLCDIEKEGVFTQPDVVHSHPITFLLSRLVDIHPTEALSTLIRLLEPIQSFSFDHKSAVENIMLSLEKLCFRSVVFESTCALWLSFIDKLNDPIMQQQAAHKFAQLFQVCHSGTTASLPQRLAALKAHLSSKETKTQAQKEALIKALGTAIRFEQLPREKGAEFQGSGKTLVEWSPTSMEAQEVKEYRLACLNLLLDHANIASNFGQKASLEVLTRLKDIASTGLLASTVQKIHKALSRCTPIVATAKQKIQGLLTTKPTLLSPSDITHFQTLSTQLDATLATQIHPSKRAHSASSSSSEEKVDTPIVKKR